MQAELQAMRARLNAVQGWSPQTQQERDVKDALDALGECVEALAARGRQEATRDAVDAVARAINDPGPDANYHRRIVERHRREWPTLWRALDELLDAAGIPRRY